MRPEKEGRQPLRSVAVLLLSGCKGVAVNQTPFQLRDGGRSQGSGALTQLYRSARGPRRTLIFLASSVAQKPRLLHTPFQDFSGVLPGVLVEVGCTCDAGLTGRIFTRVYRCLRFRLRRGLTLGLTFVCEEFVPGQPRGPRPACVWCSCAGFLFRRAPGARYGPDESRPFRPAPRGLGAAAPSGPSLRPVPPCQRRYRVHEVAPPQPHVVGGAEMLPALECSACH